MVPVSGGIYYAGSGMPVPGVTLDINPTPAGGAALPQPPQTDANGQFTFSAAAGGNCTFHTQMTAGAGSAITPGDAAVVLNAVVNGPTMSAAQKMACDVSGDGTLTPLDAVLILNYVTGNITNFPAGTACNSDWAFFPVPTPTSNQVLIQPQLWSPACQLGGIGYQPLSATATGQDFSAVLFGDCNLNWQPSGTGSTALRVSAQRAARAGFGHARRHGERLQIPLHVQAAGAFHALTARVQYDPAVLTFHKVRLIGAARGALVVTNPRVPGHLAIALASPGPLPSGTELGLEFVARSARRAAPALRVLQVTVE